MWIVEGRVGLWGCEGRVCLGGIADLCAGLGGGLVRCNVFASAVVGDLWLGFFFDGWYGSNEREWVWNGEEDQGDS